MGNWLMSDAVVSRVTGEARMIRRRRGQLRQRRHGLVATCAKSAELTRREGERQRQELAVRGAGQQSGAGLGSVFGWSGRVRSAQVGNTSDRRSRPEDRRRERCGRRA
jgi:hypothetical protein